MNLHIQPRSIYISRHGESEFNLKGLIGGDSKLSPKGRQYAARLNEFVQSESCKNLSVWCSTLQRTIETASYIKGHKAIRWKALDELDAGLCDGMTYEETAEKYPEMCESTQHRLEKMVASSRSCSPFARRTLQPALTSLTPPPPPPCIATCIAAPHQVPVPAA